MSVGCDEGTFRFPEKCDEVTLSPCIFCDAVTKISANREKKQVSRINRVLRQSLHFSEAPPNFCACVASAQ